MTKKQTPFVVVASAAAALITGSVAAQPVKNNATPAIAAQSGSMIAASVTANQPQWGMPVKELRLTPDDANHFTIVFDLYRDQVSVERTLLNGNAAAAADFNMTQPLDPVIAQRDIAQAKQVIDQLCAGATIQNYIMTSGDLMMPAEPRTKDQSNALQAFCKHSVIKRVKEALDGVMQAIAGNRSAFSRLGDSTLDYAKLPDPHGLGSNRPGPTAATARLGGSVPA